MYIFLLSTIWWKLKSFNNDIICDCFNDRPDEANIYLLISVIQSHRRVFSYNNIIMPIGNPRSFKITTRCWWHQVTWISKLKKDEKYRTAPSRLEGKLISSGCEMSRLEWRWFFLQISHFALTGECVAFNQQYQSIAFTCYNIVMLYTSWK